MARAFDWKLFLAGLVVAACLLGLTARRTDVGEQADLVASIPAAGWAWIGVACGFQLAHLVGRSTRWHFLFAPVRPRIRRLFSALTIGYLCNNVVPRSGELVRMWLVGRRETALGFVGVAVTVAAERLLDVVMILTLALILLYVSDLTALELVPSEATFWALIGIAAGLAVAVLGVVVWSEWLRPTFEHAATLLPVRLRGPVATIVGHGFAGLATLRRTGVRGFTAVIALCALDWFLVMQCHRTVAIAFGVELSVLEVSFVMVASGLGAMLPSGPGNVGSMVYLMTRASEHTAIAHAAPAYAVTTFLVYYVVRSTSGAVSLLVEARHPPGDEPV